MRKIYMMLLTVLFAATSNAQNVNVNPGAGSYPTLKDAFDAINAGTHTGAITVDIAGNTTETLSAVLNASGTGSASYTSITISPTGGAARMISGSIAGHLIDLNDADNVTINGLNTGGNSLTIENTLSAATPTAIRFIADATNNTITNCTIMGAGTSATLGTVFFSTGTATGNDGNNINNCNITSSGANFATNAIYSLGTSAAIDNSGNTLNANNISDYFIATGSASIGIFLAATGNSAWTITNNKLFQTATRIYTSSQAGLCGMSVQSGSGYTITGNIIGYANTSGTGTTNIVGNSVPLTGTFPSSYTTTGTANATRYIAISCAFTAAGTVSTIQNNTIAGFALYTSSGAATTNGIFCGINVTSGNVDIGTVTGNTIGATSGNGSIYTACTTSGGTIVGIFATSANTVNIQNNTFGAIEAMGTTASISGGITGINTAGTATTTISNNTIGNTTNPGQRMGNLTTGANLSNIGTTFSTATGTGTYTGILNSASGTVTISNNTIRNAFANNSATGAAFRGINISSGNYTISNNTINNISSASTNTTVATGLLAGVGILGQGGTVGSVMTQNTINALSLTNTTATGTNVAGISLSNSAVDVNRNRIYDLSNASTSVTATTPGSASGIFIRSGTAAGNMNIVNNMISLGNGQTTNTCFIGIWANHGSAPNPNDNLYFNSVHIEGAAAAGANPSFGFHRGNFAVTPVNQVVVDIRNNIFNNTRTGGTGAHYAIGNFFNATTVSAVGWAANASNFNVLNSASATTIGHWQTAQTFAGWQAASASDANSISGGAINFVNTVTADLHITTPYPSLIESAGTNIVSVTVDYDGQTRSTLTPVDIGADAGDFSNSPSISLTPLANTCATGARILSTNITDPDGVPTSGIGLPVLYWRINAGAYTPATATFVSGSQYDFTFGAGAVTGDVVSYYIVAQDNLGNVGSSPLAGASGFTINPPAAATPPTSPYSYLIAPTLSGTYTVGVGGNYTTLTAAVNAYNTACLGGAVLFSLIDATYPSETFPISINSNSFASAVNTLTINPAAGNACILSGSNANALIKLNGADYVTIDGLNTGGASLNINNTNAAGLTVMWIASASTTDGATNNTIKNCTISGISSTGSVGCIIGGSGTVLGNPADAPNSNNTIQGNILTTAQNGIYISGNLATLDQNWVINGNTIGSAVVANKMGFRGLSVQGVNNFAISNNTINGVVTATTSTSTGISTFVTATNGNIFNNKISDIKNTNAGGFGTNGIGLQGTSTTSNINVYNNFISDIAGIGFGGTAIGDNGYGIIITAGGGYNLYYNTVVMNTNQTAATGLPAALNVTSGVTTASSLNIRNNIFVNTQTIGTQRYCVFSGAAATVYADINYNDYYFTGPNLGNIGGVLRANLAAWQTGTGKDANSWSDQPIFVSATDLHLSNAPGANWCLNGTGQTIATYTTDIDGDTRGTPPDIGADEFNTTGDAVATPSSQTICSGATITTIVLSGTATSYNWTRDNSGTVTGIAASGSGDISGALTNTTFAPVTVTFTITPVNAVGCFGPAITATVLVNPTPDAVATPSSQTICSDLTITTIVLTGNVSGTTYNWTRDNTVTVTGIAASGSGDISGALTNTTASPVTVTFTITPIANGCPGTPITATVTVDPCNISDLDFINQGSCNDNGTPNNLTDDYYTADVVVTFSCPPVSGNLILEQSGAVIDNTHTIPVGSLVGNSHTFTTVRLRANGLANPAKAEFTAAPCIRIENAPAVAVCSVPTCPQMILAGTSPFQDSAWTIDVSDGNVITRFGPTLAGFTVTGINSITRHPGPAGDVYAILKLSAVSGRVLAKMDLTTGVCTQIGNLGDNFSTLTFKYNAIDTVLYGVTGDGATVPETMYSIDHTTGVKTLFRALGNGADGEVIVYNPDDSKFYHWSGNGTVVWERFGTGAGDPIEPLTYTGYSSGEIFGAVYIGNGRFLVSTIASAVYVWDVAGNVGPALFGTPDDLRGLVVSHNGPLCDITDITFSNQSPCNNNGTIGDLTDDYYTADITVLFDNKPCTGDLRLIQRGAVMDIIPLVPVGSITGNSYTFTAVRLRANGLANLVETDFTAIPDCYYSETAPVVNECSSCAVTCPANMTVSNDLNQCGAIVNFIITTTGGCGTVTATPASGSFFPLGTTTVIVTTVAGPSCSFTVTVNDTQSPTITCPANITVSNDPNQCGAVVNYPAPAISDNCPGVTVNAVPASGSFFPVGTTTVTATATDAVGNTASCTFTVTVNDTQPPTITCPANIALCGGSQVINYPPPTATDNCPGVTVVSIPASGSVFPVGVTTVTATATDASGNTATCTFTVTITPIPSVNPIPNQTVCNAAPTAPVVFSGPVPGTVYNWVNNTPSIGLAASGSGNIASFNAINLTNVPVTATITVTPVTSNNVTQTFNYTGAFQTFVVPAGITSVNIQASGAQGRANAAGVSMGGLGGLASGNLAVTPGETLWVYVGGGGTTGATGGFNGGGNGGTTGTCLNALGGGGGGASDVRQLTNTLAGRRIVGGGGGGTAGNRVAACARGAGGGGGGGYYGGGGGSGYPGTAGVVPTGGTQVAGGTGGITGTTFGATNGLPGVLGIGGAGGNEIFSNQAGSQAIIFGSGIGGGLNGGPGQQSGLNNFTGQSGAGGSSYIGGVTGGSTTAGVRSGNGLVTISYVVPGPVCTGPPSSFTITVNPTPNAVAAPTTQTICSGTAMTPIVLSGNVAGTVFNWTRNNLVNVTGIPNAGSGNISGTPINITGVQQIVTYTITPVANGCTGTPITATLIVNIAPTITCPANITVNNTPGQCGANVTYPPATATGSPPPVITYSQASGTFFPVGTTTVTATATNICGVATCTFTITVLDVQNPTITCPANIVRNTDVGVCTATIAVPNPTIADNCAVTQLTWVMTGATTGSSPATGINFVGTQTFNLNGTTGSGVTTIVYTVRDAAGNTATCSFTVTVIDAWIPVIGGQPTNLTTCVGSDAAFTVTAAVPAGNPLTYQWQTWNGTAWVNIAGATNATLPLPAVTLSMNTNTYRCILTGRCSVVTSGFATLYVNALPTVSILASGPTALLPAQSVTLTAVVSPGGGAYQWFKNGVAIAGATSASLAGLTVDDIGTYRVRYTDLNGCVRTSADMVISGQVSGGLFIYPVPNDGHFHVRFYNQANEEVTIRVFDMRGALVYLKKVITTLPYTDIDVDMRNRITATEAYLVEVRGGNGRLIGAKKIIVFK